MFKVAHEAHLKNTKGMVVSRARMYDSSYGNHTLGGARLQEVKSLGILCITFDSKLFETHSREVVPKQLGVWAPCAVQES